jgi:nitrogenase molybdenum-iron protein NifN
MLFGAQGCAASGLIFLSRYYGEEITLKTVNMNDLDTIDGGQVALKTAIDDLSESKPEMIAVVTTGTMDAQGACAASLPNDKQVDQDHSQPQMLFLHTPDFEGSLQDGWGTATQALVHHALQRSYNRSAHNKRKLVLLPGSHVSVGDLEWLKDAAESFELTPLIIPDISTALDGRFGDEDHSSLLGGTRLSELDQVLDGGYFLALGEQMRGAADELTSAHLPGELLTGLTGMQRTDYLLKRLAEISGISIAKKYQVQRRQLMDAMIDNVRYLSRINAAIAAEPDLLIDLCWWLKELGANILEAMSPTNSSSLRNLPLKQVFAGDYQLLSSKISQCNFLLAPDSARKLAQDAGIPHYTIGIHEQRYVGAQHMTRMGYRGARSQLFALVNLFLQ